ncbi:MAG: hypothetical protein ACLTYN_04940 [Dysosmobacter welbionis]
MKKEHCVLILICCSHGGLRPPGRHSGGSVGVSRDGTERDRRDPAGPQFETLTVADDPITAEFSLTTRQEQAAFLYVTVEEDCTTTVNCTYASQDQPVTVCLAGGESWELPGASEEAYGAIWSNWPVTLRQGENVFYITGGGSFCRMRLELLDAAGVSCAGAFPEGQNWCRRRESGQQAAGIDGSTCGRFAERPPGPTAPGGLFVSSRFCGGPRRQQPPGGPKQHPAAGQHGKEQQEGGGLRIIKIGEDRHQMGGGVQISAQKEEQPQADSQDQNPGPDPPAFPGPQKNGIPVTRAEIQA